MIPISSLIDSIFRIKDTDTQNMYPRALTEFTMHQSKLPLCFKLFVQPFLVIVMSLAALSPGPIKVAVGSGNPCKLAAVKDAFKDACDASIGAGKYELLVEGVSAESGVSDQPMGDEETMKGARNRAEGARDVMRAQSQEPDFAVGLEGGIVDEGEEMWCMAWMAVLRVSTGEWGVARTAAFPLPKLMTALVRKGMELGDADDAVTGRSGSKTRGGTVGVVTQEVIPRGEYYRHALVLALARFTAEDIFGMGMGEDGHIDEALVNKLLQEKGITGASDGAGTATDAT